MESILKKPGTRNLGLYARR